MAGIASDLSAYDAFVGIKKAYCMALSLISINDPDTCDLDKPVSYLIKSTQRINNSPGYALQGGIYQGVENTLSQLKVKLILTTPRITPGSVIEISASFIDPTAPTKIDSIIY